jgi:hypothetical protein
MNSRSLDLDLASNRELVRVLTRAFASDRGLDGGVVLDIARARARALDLDQAPDCGQEQHGPGRVVPSADCLLAAAARLLPAADRARYIEEYRSELWQIAHAGRSARSQMLYALRQLASSVRLHAELRTPRQRKAPL